MLFGLLKIGKISENPQFSVCVQSASCAVGAPDHQLQMEVETGSFRPNFPKSFGPVFAESSISFSAANGPLRQAATKRKNGKQIRLQRPYSKGASPRQYPQIQAVVSKQVRYSK